VQGVQSSMHDELTRMATRLVVLEQALRREAARQQQPAAPRTPAPPRSDGPR
jgi:hypothetical protein